MNATTRLVLAAVVCAVSLGLGWQASRASTGYQTPGMVLPTTNVAIGSDDLWIGSQYYPGYWVEGDPMRARRGFEADVRVVLVPAALALAWVSQVRSEKSVRVARVAMIALAAIGLQALGRGMVAAALSVVVVLVLAAPAVGPDWLRRVITRVGSARTHAAAA